MRISPRNAIAGLFPGYFAMVMATGIIAVGASQQHFVLASKGLTTVAIVAYVVLIAMTVSRLVLFPRKLVADLMSHDRGFTFLTTVIGTNVLGSAVALVFGWWDFARYMWILGLILWVVLLYGTLISVVVRDDKPEFGEGVNGTWFLITVSLQSITILGALLLTRHPSELVTFLCVASFGLGIVLYLIVMTMVFTRWTFHSPLQRDSDPTAWVATGAVASTVLAGSNLLNAHASSARIDQLASFLQGMVILAWATATFWFPLLIALGVWRHFVKRVPLRYHPSYWAIVYPLGMYGAATFRMRAVLSLDALGRVPLTMWVVAIVVWMVAMIGLVHTGIVVAGQRNAPGAAPDVG